MESRNGVLTAPVDCQIFRLDYATNFTGTNYVEQNRTVTWHANCDVDSFALYEFVAKKRLYFSKKVLQADFFLPIKKQLIFENGPQKQPCLHSENDNVFVFRSYLRFEIVENRAF